MKSFAVIAIVLCLTTAVPADNQSDMQDRSYGGGGGGGAAAPAASSYSAPAAPPSYSAPAAPSYSAPAAAPAPITIPAPPCPKNYLFSCQPSLTPAPCSQAAAYNSAGAYSQNYPVYAIPQYVNSFQSYY